MVPGVFFEDRSIHVRDAPGTLAGLKEEARGDHLHAVEQGILIGSP